MISPPSTEPPVVAEAQVDMELETVATVARADTESKMALPADTVDTASDLVLAPALAPVFDREPDPALDWSLDLEPDLGFVQVSAQVFGPVSVRGFAQGSGRASAQVFARVFVPGFGLAFGRVFVRVLVRVFVPEFGLASAQGSGRASARVFGLVW